VSLSRQDEMKERRQLAGSTTGTTYYERAQADQQLERQGRFAGVNPPLQEWPKLPSGPWSGADPVGPEPPLGFSVNDQEPVGSYQEIQASLDRLGRGPSSETSSPSVDGTVTNTAEVAPAADRDIAPLSSTEGSEASLYRRRFR
jgi:hypothetical protein